MYVVMTAMSRNVRLISDAHYSQTVTIWHILRSINIILHVTKHSHVNWRFLLQLILVTLGREVFLDFPVVLGPGE